MTRDESLLQLERDSLAVVEYSTTIFPPRCRVASTTDCYFFLVTSVWPRRYVATVQVKIKLATPNDDAILDFSRV